jgi:transposase
LICIQNEKDKRKNPTILIISDNLWDEIKSIFPKEKSSKTVVGRPIVKYRKVLDDGILYVLRTGYQWKMLPKQRVWFKFYLS